MKNFITVHMLHVPSELLKLGLDVEGKEFWKPVKVNVNHITTIEDNEEGTATIGILDTVVDIKETEEELEELIKTVEL